jgi:hypothetical protein
MKFLHAFVEARHAVSYSRRAAEMAIEAGAPEPVVKLVVSGAFSGETPIESMSEVHGL